MRKRIKKIFGYVANNLDVIVIKNSSESFIDPSFFYVTGFEQGIFEECIVILYPDGGTEVLVSQVEKESVQKTHFEVFDNLSQRHDILSKKLKGKNIGVNFSCLSHKDFIEFKKISDTDLIDVGYAVQKARLIKEKKEIEYLKKACQISSNVADGIGSLMRDGMTECDMASEIVYQIHKGGGTMAFNPIVAFGKNSAHPHYSFSVTKLGQGPALFDFGAKYKRYCSDITRTFHYGKPPDKFLKMYKTVLEAQQVALGLIKPGVPVADIHREVNAFIKQKGFGNLIHSTGHSLGLAVHDGGTLNTCSQLILSEGMVFTIEPGIYIPYFGGVRIEDDIVVRKNGIEMLTRSQKDYDSMIV